MAILSAIASGWTTEIQIPTQAIVWEYLKHQALHDTIIAQQQLVAVGMDPNSANVTAQLDVLDALLHELDAHFSTIPAVTMTKE